MAKKKTKKSPLTLHGLLAAISYWGTASRLFLAAFVAVAVFAIALTETNGSASAISAEVIILIYALASILLLDSGYVVIARAMPLRRVLDVASLLVADLVLLGLYVAPKVTVMETTSPVNPVGIVLLLAILALALRLLLGFLFGTKRKA